MIGRALLAFLALACQSRAGSLTLDARAAFDSSDFETARRSYEEAEKQGLLRDANDFVVRGNTYFRLGDKGRALLNYERALAAIPSSPEALANLKFVRERTGARVPEDDWRERVLSMVRPAVAAWIAIGMAWLGYAGILLWSGARRKMPDSTPRGGPSGSSIAGAIAGGVLVVAGATYAAGVVWLQSREARNAIVVLEKADARTEPADRAGLAESLPAGSRVRLLGEHGAWSYCELPQGGRGWIATTAVEKILNR